MQKGKDLERERIFHKCQLECMNICNQHLSLYLNTNLVSVIISTELMLIKLPVTYSPKMQLFQISSHRKQKTTHTITQTHTAAALPNGTHEQKCPHRDPWKAHTHKCLRLPLLHLRPTRAAVRVKRPYCISVRCPSSLWDNLQKGWRGCLNHHHIILSAYTRPRALSGAS